MELIEELKEYLAQATRIVFLGGAGDFHRKRYSGFSQCTRFISKKSMP